MGAQKVEREATAVGRGSKGAGHTLVCRSRGGFDYSAGIPPCNVLCWGACLSMGHPYLSMEHACLRAQNGGGYAPFFGVEADGKGM